MLKIIVNKKENLIKKVTFIGHAMYDDYGKDIVCAASSSILITTVNAILKYNSEAIEVNESKNVVVNVLYTDKFINILLDNMIDLLKDLESQYRKNIIIREEDNDE